MKRTLALPNLHAIFQGLAVEPSTDLRKTRLSGALTTCSLWKAGCYVLREFQTTSVVFHHDFHMLLFEVIPLLPSKPGMQKVTSSTQA